MIFTAQTNLFSITVTFIFIITYAIITLRQSMCRFPLLVRG
nr:MAG TPA: hypothetical protein [Caudoviricetes sp.]